MNCSTCKTPLRSPSDDGRCGLCRIEALHKTVAALGEGPPDSTLAAWSLLERGVPRRAVVLGLRAVRSGTAVDEVAEGLGGLLETERISDANFRMQVQPERRAHA